MSPTLRKSSTNSFKWESSIAYLSFIFQCSFFLSDAQSPGGVSSGITGWYNASTGITLTGGVVSGWADQSVNARHGSQATNANRPLVNSTGFNYNQTLSFDGQTDYISIPNQMASSVTAMSCFVVARQTASNRDQWASLLLGQGAAAASGQGYGITTSQATNNEFGFFVNSFGVNNASYVSNLATPAIMTGNYNGVTAGNLLYYQDGTYRDFDTYNSTIGNGGNSYIGSAETGGNFCFYGDIAEVAIYSVGLSLANMNKIESYLGLKYSITLGSSYVNSAGSTIFTTASPYNNNIIGIGRDDNSVLNQKQSKNYDDSVRIFINTLAASNSANAGTFAGNNQFVVVGANTSPLSAQFAEKPAGVYSRLSREWKVTNTGFTGSFSFSIKLNSKAALSSLNPAHLRLLVDLDGNFTDATIINPTITYANPLVTISGIAITDIPTNSTRYITLASNTSNSPLPIELLSFESLLCLDEVCIKWKTATEKDNDHFDVTRSIDGQSWQLVNTVKGAGNSYQTLSYESRDMSPLTGTSYYRLNQVDVDGTIHYSPISSVRNESDYKLELKSFPNPSNSEALIPGFRASELHVYNVLGSKIDASLISDGIETIQTTIKTATLAEGIYFVATTSNLVDPKRRVIRIVVKH